MTSERTPRMTRRESRRILEQEKVNELDRRWRSLVRAVQTGTDEQIAGCAKNFFQYVDIREMLDDSAVSLHITSRITQIVAKDGEIYFAGRGGASHD